MTGLNKLEFAPQLKKKLLNIKIDNSSQLGYYLAGLIEGDGSIIVPQKIRNEAGNLLYPIIKITSSKKDLPLFERIIQTLGGGTIEEPKGMRASAPFTFSKY